MTELSPEVRDVLREAKGLVAAYWFQDGGQWVCTVDESPHLAHCLHTAISEASQIGDRGSAFVEALRAVRSELGLRPSDADGLFDWNDAPERTHAEVVALFDRVLAGSVLDAAREVVREKTDCAVTEPSLPGLAAPSTDTQVVA